MKCPDDKRVLESGACPLCKGAFVSESDLSEQVPGAVERLSIETREKSGAFARRRLCPGCGGPMAPWRIDRDDAWIEKCQSCESFWVEKLDFNVLRRVRKQQVMREAAASLSPEEKRELIVDAMAGAGEYPLSPAHQLLAWAGLPVVTRTRGSRTPWACWTLALVMLVAHGLRSEEVLENWAYFSAEPSALTALTSCFLHFSWPHLLGNLWFLLAFGDGVEQRLPRSALLAAFALAGAASTAIQGAVLSEAGVIVGASGGIATIMGLCVMLQPQARVTSRIFAYVFRLPILGYAGIEVTWQTAMALLGVPGTAWTAHLAGMVAGFALGGAIRVLAPEATPAPG